MKDYTYSSYSSAPWYKYRSSVNTVIIKDGVTSIGDYAFSGCMQLRTLDIPKSVSYVGKYLFQDCVSMKTVTVLNPDATVHQQLLWKSEDICVRGYTFSDAHKAVLYASGYTYAGTFESIGVKSGIDVWADGSCGDDLV